MSQVLRQLPAEPSSQELLVGNETSDDAGVFQITDEIALVQSVDYFTPIVDDPYMFGQIAAANALSDIYAMGGTPKTALNIVGYPVKKLGSKILAQILTGAADKVRESGATTVGGHSIDDQEPKFGLSVTGIVNPMKVWRNSGAKPGEILILTKPLGVGILTTGIKRGVVTEDQEQSVTNLMSTLNKMAAEILSQFKPGAVTDVTGFGLLGHASEIANGSAVSLELNYSSIPLIEGTYELALQGVVPGGTKANYEWLKDTVEYDSTLSIQEQMILCDSITSGGLLISLTEKEADEFIELYNQRSPIKAAIIGRVAERMSAPLIVHA
ncbi:selenide,water dikinase [Bacillus pakistanensis]|uniref:Selenide, water dikinase n=1 Tax=Rossellomorea pakistanensis TaxID=992288 RepID=A0ABS2N7T5_9BACI|nr:selenide,water dikinase [Bacillus pakistanensis]